MFLRTGLLMAVCAAPIISGQTLSAQETPQETPQETQSANLSGIQFPGQPGTQYVEIRALGEALGWPVRGDSETGTLALKEKEIPQDQRRRLPNGAQVMPVRALKAWGAQVRWDQETRAAFVEADGKRIVVAANRVSILDGVTFAENPGILYAPIRALGRALGKSVRRDKDANTLYWDEKPVVESAVRTLPDGTHLLALRGLKGPEGVTVAWRAEAGAAEVVSKAENTERTAWVREGKKRVAVSIDAQRMRAWQGDLLVLDTNVSTGRSGHATPKGSYTAGPLKTPLLISYKYNNARMPWSVQIRGDIVIHGYTSVPPRAASHGCVRVPLTGANPAKWFYDWVDVGTPIEVRDEWPKATTTT